MPSSSESVYSPPTKRTRYAIDHDLIDMPRTGLPDHVRGQIAQMNQVPQEPEVVLLERAGQMRTDLHRLGISADFEWMGDRVGRKLYWEFIVGNVDLSPCVEKKGAPW